MTGWQNWAIKKQAMLDEKIELCNIPTHFTKKTPK